MRPDGVAPLETLHTPLVLRHLVGGIHLHIGVAKGREPFGFAVLEIDTHIGAHADVDAHQALLGSFANLHILSDIVDHLSRAKNIGPAGLAVVEENLTVLAPHLVELLSVDLLDGEHIVFQQHQLHAIAVEVALDGVGRALVVFVPYHGVEEERHARVGHGEPHRVAHCLSVGAEDAHAAIGRGGLKLVAVVVESPYSVGVHIERIALIHKDNKSRIGDEREMLLMVGDAHLAIAGDVVGGVEDNDVAVGLAVLAVVVEEEGVGHEARGAVGEACGAVAAGVVGGGVVGALLAVDRAAVADDGGGRDKFGHVATGVVEEGVGVEPSIAVVEHHLVEEVDIVRIAVVVALMAVEGGAVVDGMAPMEVGGGALVAVVAQQVGSEDGAAIDEGDGVAPHVGDAGGAVVEGVVAIEGSGVADDDFDVAHGPEGVVFGVESSGIGIKRHAFVHGLDFLKEHPDITVGGVARAHAGLVGDYPLGLKSHAAKQREQRQQYNFQQFQKRNILKKKFTKIHKKT